MTRTFGLKSSPAQRGNTIVRRLPDVADDGFAIHAGDPSLLTSAKRSEVLAQAALVDDLYNWHFE